MLRVQKLSNKYQKRLVRPVYAQSQATPYACTLDDTFRSATDGSLVLPKSGDTTPLNTRTAAAYTLKSSLVSGVVMVRTLAEKVAVATGINSGTTEVPFGLLSNFVGGELDDIGDENQVGVWRGPDAVFDIISPGFDSTGLSAAYLAAATGNPVKLYAGTDGRLTIAANLSGGTANAATPAVARLIELRGTNVIRVDLLV